MAGNRFKVSIGGASNWNTNGSWSASSGGSSGASFPLQTETALCDGNSGVFACSVNVASACLALDCNGFTGTLSGSQSLTIGASQSSAGALNLRLASGMTLSYSGALAINPNGTGAQVTSAGKTFSGTVTVTASNGTNGVQLQDAFNSTSTLTITRGVFDSNGKAITATAFASSNSNARTLTLTSSAIALSGTGTVWNLATTTNLAALTTTSASITTTDTSGTAITFAGGSQTYACSLTITGRSGTFTFTGNNTFSGAFASGATPLVFTGTTQTFNGTVDLTGCTSIAGGTMTCNSGTVTAPSGCTLTNSTFSGTATPNATAATDGGGNSGWGTIGGGSGSTARSSICWAD